MNNDSFGDYIRKNREDKKLPLRKVAAHLDIDQSTLSKVERGERPASAEYLGPLADILQLDLKDVQARFIADKISKDFAGMEHLTEGLKVAEQQLRKKRR